MVDAPRVIPRDDRAWPRGSAVVSVVLGLGAVGAGVVVEVAVASRGWPVMAFVGAGFVLTFGVALAMYVSGLGQWLAGHPFPVLHHLLLWAAFAAAVVVLVLVDGPVGGSMLAGLLAGLTLTNAWAIRVARRNRQRVDDAEDARDDRALDREAYVPEHRMQDLPVGRVLRDTVAAERRRAWAWLIALVVVTAACFIADAPAVVPIGVVAMGGVALAWTVRRLWGVWLALRDFTRAATSPRRAFVVLLHDPAPRMMRPLLATWSEPPAVRGGRVPKPERVYRCDEEQDALECVQDNVVVHEAWVDTGPRPASKPRWVAADAGIALPHRRALFGRWYMSRLMAGARPDRPEPLRRPPPHPDTAPAVDIGADTDSFAARLAWRIAGLAVVALLFYWLA